MSFRSPISKRRPRPAASRRRTHRSLGLVHRARKELPAAKASFQRYLELDPKAPDASMIKTYLEEST